MKISCHAENASLLEGFSMHAVIPISSSHGNVSVRADVLPETALKPNRVEYVFKKLDEPLETRRSLSEDKFPVGAQERFREKCQNISNNSPANLRKTAQELANFLQQYCAVPSNNLFTEERSSFSLRESTLYKQQEELLSLIAESRRPEIADPEAASLVGNQNYGEEGPVVEILEPTIDKNPPANRTGQLPGGSSTDLLDDSEPPARDDSAKGAVARGSSADKESKRKSPLPSSAGRAVGTRMEANLQKELYSLTQVMNARATTRWIYVSPFFASCACISNLITLLLTTNIPRCTDEYESSHKDSIYALRFVTASFSLAACITSFFSRTAFLPYKMPVYNFANPAITELSQDEVTDIKRKIEQQGEKFPECLLPKSAKQIRKNMLALACYAKMDRVLQNKLRPAEAQISPALSIEDKFLEHSRVVSWLNLAGSGLMLITTAAQITLRYTEDITVLGCPQNTNSSATLPPHDPRNDLTNYCIGPFIGTCIGFACLAIDCLQKRIHNRGYLAQRYPSEVTLE